MVNLWNAFAALRGRVGRSRASRGDGIAHIDRGDEGTALATDEVKGGSANNPNVVDPNANRGKWKLEDCLR